MAFPSGYISVPATKKYIVNLFTWSKSNKLIWCLTTACQRTSSALTPVLQSLGGGHAPDTIFSLFFGFPGIVVSRISDWARGSEDGILPRIDEEFRALVVNSEITHLRFDGRAAEIAVEYQEHYTDEGTNASTLLRTSVQQNETLHCIHPKLHGHHDTG